MSLDWKTFKNHYKINNFTKSFNDFSENQVSFNSTTDNINLNKINNVEYDGLGNTSGGGSSESFDIITAKKIGVGITIPDSSSKLIVNEDTGPEFIDDLHATAVFRNRAFDKNYKFLHFGSYHNLPALWASGISTDYNMIINPPQKSNNGGDPRVGNVGIGVTNPKTTLDVSGVIQSNNAIRSEIKSGNSTKDIIELGKNQYGARLLITDSIPNSARWEIYNNQDNRSLDFTLNNSQYIRVDNVTGNIDVKTNITRTKSNIDETNKNTIPNIEWVKEYFTTNNSDLWDQETVDKNMHLKPKITDAQLHIHKLLVDDMVISKSFRTLEDGIGFQDQRTLPNIKWVKEHVSNSITSKLGDSLTIRGNKSTDTILDVFYEDGAIFQGSASTKGSCGIKISSHIGILESGRQKPKVEIDAWGNGGMINMRSENFALQTDTGADGTVTINTTDFKVIHPNDGGRAGGTFTIENGNLVMKNGSMVVEGTNGISADWFKTRTDTVNDSLNNSVPNIKWVKDYFTDNNSDFWDKKISGKTTYLVPKNIGYHVQISNMLVNDFIEAKSFRTSDFSFTDLGDRTLPNVKWVKEYFADNNSDFWDKKISDKTTYLVPKDNNDHLEISNIIVKDFVIAKSYRTADFTFTDLGDKTLPNIKWVKDYFTENNTDLWQLKDGTIQLVSKDAADQKTVNIAQLYVEKRIETTGDIIVKGYNGVEADWFKTATDTVNDSLNNSVPNVKWVKEYIKNAGYAKLDSAPTFTGNVKAGIFISDGRVISQDADPAIIPNIDWVLTHLASDNVDINNINGDVKVIGDVEASTFIATSDKNKKENIETISDATNKIESLRGVSYKLKSDNTKTHYGVVAQELEEVFPDMVHGEEGNKSVAYMEIIGVLIETVKDLNKRIKILEQTSNK